MASDYFIFFFTIPAKDIPESVNDRETLIWDFLNEAGKDINQSSLFICCSRRNWFVGEILNHVSSNHVLRFLEKTIWIGRRPELLSAISELAKIESDFYHSPPRDTEDVKTGFQLAEFDREGQLKKGYYASFFAFMNCVIFSMSEAVAKDYCFVYYLPPV